VARASQVVCARCS